MASSRARMERSEGESSSASQANRGLVMAIFMPASHANEMCVAPYPYTTQLIPVGIGGWSKNPKKPGGGRFLYELPSAVGGSTLAAARQQPEKTRSRDFATGSAGRRS